MMAWSTFKTSFSHCYTAASCTWSTFKTSVCGEHAQLQPRNQRTSQFALMAMLLQVGHYILHAACMLAKTCARALVWATEDRSRASQEDKQAPASGKTGRHAFELMGHACMGVHAIQTIHAMPPEAPHNANVKHASFAAFVATAAATNAPDRGRFHRHAPSPGSVPSTAAATQ